MAQVKKIINKKKTFGGHIFQLPCSSRDYLIYINDNTMYFGCITSGKVDG